MRKLSVFLCLFATAALAQTDNQNQPTWWNKYQHLLNNGAMSGGAATSSTTLPSNVDVSNECGPQSETYITLNTTNTSNLAGGSNEIFRLPMRGYSSTDGGQTWDGVDLPLPLAKGNGIDFGSDPTLAFDTHGALYYGFIVVFFGNGNGINGTEMAVAKSTDGGKTYPKDAVTYFSFEGGENHFNDKPMITTDLNSKSPFRDNVYIAWDAASGGSTSGGIRVARSSDHGKTFTVTRADDPQGPGRAIGAVPFVGTEGELYVAWNDYSANTIAFNRSLDGGVTWGKQSVIANKQIPFDIRIPAELFRGALVYPACDVDRSKGANRGRLVCSWMDLVVANGTTDIFTSFSDNQGLTWSPATSATDPLPFAVDRFNQWLSIDPTNGVVNVSFYDTRNDTTGKRYMTDTYLSRSSDDKVTFGPNVQVSSFFSNEHDCDGVFPCSAIDYGNQQGDYEGVVAFGGVAYPIWTDSRRQLETISGCRNSLAMEEVFTASVK